MFWCWWFCIGSDASGDDRPSGDDENDEYDDDKVVVGGGDVVGGGIADDDDAYDDGDDEDDDTDKIKHENLPNIIIFASVLMIWYILIINTSSIGHMARRK